ncbi:DUF3152 domain-containing protein [Catenuloplanes atrovinosus]|uniref:DUF3152 domain-containing protein n=1 Tax=Catenuloplanes atrovinosus TaxID=137266 RepID=A0AAE4CD80_9ACTN|nr:DUF3152 domain-containing protein [Catenuloplanes atrovinosus]MDR7277260.1 hypothetical protein [Catenuloplanes atrovinosus]
MSIRVRQIAGMCVLTTLLSACGTAADLPRWQWGAPSPEAPQASPTVPIVEDHEVPKSGSGIFAVADGTGEVIGRGGEPITFRVEVETGIDWGDVEPVTPDDFADTIDTVFKDPRSWAGSTQHPVTVPDQGVTNASWRFRRVDGEVYKVRVRLATPNTVDQQCAAAGLDTEGKYSCRYNDTIMVNLGRWLQGLPESGSLDEYRASVINHEMGHFLGFVHQKCSGSGNLAPVMMQQSMGLDGCLPNAWPFTEEGEFVTGPRVPGEY